MLTFKQTFQYVVSCSCSVPFSSRWCFVLHVYTPHSYSSTHHSYHLGGGFCMHGPPSHIDIYVGCQHNIYASYFCSIFYDHLMTTKELFTRVGGLSWVSRILDRKTFHHHQSGLSCHKNQILVILIQAQQPLRALQHLRTTVTVLKPNTNNNLRSFSPKFCIPKTHQA